MKKIAGRIFLLLFILFMAGSVMKINAYSSERGENRISMEALDGYETKYQEEAQELLRDYHLYRSGMTMTKVMERDRVDYTVVIHNKKYERLTGIEKSELRNRLEKITFPEEGITLSVKFV